MRENQERLPGYLVIAVILVFIAGIPSCALAATDITSCTRITKPGEYLLKNDIIGPPVTGPEFTCIEIAHGGVIFDGGGKKIVGPELNKETRETTAISAGPGDGSGFFNVVVKDVEVSNWSIGIKFSGVSGGTISGVRAIENARSAGTNYEGLDPEGILIEYSHGIRLTNNNVERNDGGISLIYSEGVSIGTEQPCYNPFTTSVPADESNTIKNNTYNGIFLYGSDNNQITGNTITGNGISKTDPKDYPDFTSSGTLTGITLYAPSTSNTIRQNRINQNVFGIMLGSDDNEVYVNEIDDNLLYGIDINSHVGNLIHSNTIRDNGCSGSVKNGKCGAAISIRHTMSKNAAVQFYNNWIRRGTGNSFVDIASDPVLQVPDIQAGFGISPRMSPEAPTNIVGGPAIGGDYWEDASGYPGDNNGDGFADSPFCIQSGMYCVPSAGEKYTENYPLVPSASFGGSPLYPQSILGKQELLTDPDNCGECGKACVPGLICRGGICMLEKQEPQLRVVDFFTLVAQHVTSVLRPSVAPVPWLPAMDYPRQVYENPDDLVDTMSTEGESGQASIVMEKERYEAKEQDGGTVTVEVDTGQKVLIEQSEEDSGPYTHTAIEKKSSDEKPTGTVLLIEGSGDTEDDKGSAPYTKKVAKRKSSDGGTITSEMYLIGCPDGFDRCNDVCADLTSDKNNCGACGHLCGPDDSCYSGTCGATISGCGNAPDGHGLVNCNGVCADLEKDTNNCGTCGNVCSPSWSCYRGKCETAWQGPWRCESVPDHMYWCDTGDQCVNVWEDDNNCGACGNACPDGDICSEGSCVTGGGSII